MALVHDIGAQVMSLLARIRISQNAANKLQVPLVLLHAVAACSAQWKILLTVTRLNELRKTQAILSGVTMFACK